MIPIVGLALLLLVLFPTNAWAWSPGTHVFLGDAVLRSLHLLPSGVAELLQAFPYDYLYGSIAADTSMAKKYVEAGRHCHSWPVGMEILDRAKGERLRAFGLGYLSHLAADVVAHNFFVPHQLATTSSTSTLGHTYWETRFETHLGERVARRARELILLDHGAADSLLDRVLSPTLFSTSTNRRLFRGMVRVADNERWQRIFQLMLERSRWDLPDEHVLRYLDRSFNFVVDLLVAMEAAEPIQYDPSGDEPLRRAKRVRRQASRDGRLDEIHVDAAAAFGMPPSMLNYSSRLTSPLYLVARSSSS